MARHVNVRTGDERENNEENRSISHRESGKDDFLRLRENEDFVIPHPGLDPGPKVLVFTLHYDNGFPLKGPRE
ncbi:MAG: hypothetical protein ABFD12_11715 [Syntrophorhabdus sp.]